MITYCPSCIQRHFRQCTALRMVILTNSHILHLSSLHLGHISITIIFHSQARQGSPYMQLGTQIVFLILTDYSAGLDFSQFTMKNIKERVACLIFFVLCTLTTRKIVLGHFSLGRDIKKPIDQGPSVYPVRAFQSESALRKIHRTTGIVNRYWLGFHLLLDRSWEY